MGNATHQTSFTVREHMIGQLKEALAYVKEVEEGSMGSERHVWKGRDIVVSWNLTFDLPHMRFFPHVEVVAVDGTGDDDYRVLASKVRAVLEHADVPFSELIMKDWVPELRQE